MVGADQDLAFEAALANAGGTTQADDAEAIAGNGGAPDFGERNLPGSLSVDTTAVPADEALAVDQFDHLYQNGVLCIRALLARLRFLLNPSLQSSDIRLNLSASAFGILNEWAANVSDSHVLASDIGKLAEGTLAGLAAIAGLEGTTDWLALRPRMVEAGFREDVNADRLQALAGAVAALRRLRNKHGALLGHFGGEAHTLSSSEYARVVYGAEEGVVDEDGQAEDVEDLDDASMRPFGLSRTSDGLEGVVRRLAVRLEAVVQHVPHAQRKAKGQGSDKEDKDKAPDTHLSIPSAGALRAAAAAMAKGSALDARSVTDASVPSNAGDALEERLLAHARKLMRAQHPSWTEEQVLQRTPPVRRLLERFEALRRVPLALEAAAALRELEVLHAACRDLPLVRRILHLGKAQRDATGKRGKTSGAGRAFAVFEERTHELVACCAQLLPTTGQQAAQAGVGLGHGPVLFGHLQPLASLLESLGSLMADEAPSAERLRQMFTMTEWTMDVNLGGQAKQTTMTGVHFLGCAADAVRTYLKQERDVSRARTAIDAAGTPYSGVLDAAGALFRAAAHAVYGEALEGIQQRLFARHGASVTIMEEKEGLADANPAARTGMAEVQATFTTASKSSSNEHHAVHPSVVDQLLSCVETAADVLDTEWALFQGNGTPMPEQVMGVRAHTLASAARLLHRLFALNTRTRLPNTPEHRGLPLAVVTRAYRLSVRTLQQLAETCRPFFVTFLKPPKTSVGQVQTQGQDQGHGQGVGHGQNHAAGTAASPSTPEPLAVPVCHMSCTGAQQRLVLPLAGPFDTADMHPMATHASALDPSWTAPAACMRTFVAAVQGVFSAYQARFMCIKYTRIAVLERAISDKVLPLMAELTAQADAAMPAQAGAPPRPSQQPAPATTSDAAAGAGGAPAVRARRRERQASVDYQYRPNDRSGDSTGDAVVELHRTEQQEALAAAQEHAKVMAPIERARALFRTRREELLQVVSSWQTSADYDALVGHHSHPICNLAGLADAMAVAARVDDEDVVPAELREYCAMQYEALSRNMNRLASSYASVWWDVESMTQDMAGRHVAASVAHKKREFSHETVHRMHSVMQDWVSERWIHFTQRTRLRGDVSADGPAPRLDTLSAAFSLYFSHADHARAAHQTLAYRQTAMRTMPLRVANTTSEDPSVFKLRIWAETDRESGLAGVVERCLTDAVTSGVRLLAGQVLAEQQSHNRDAHKTARTLDPTRTLYLCTGDISNDLYERHQKEMIKWHAVSGAAYGQAPDLRYTEHAMWCISLAKYTDNGAQRGDWVNEIRRTRLVIQRRAADGRLIDVLLGYPVAAPQAWSEPFSRRKEWLKKGVQPRFGEEPPDDSVPSVFYPDLTLMVVRLSDMDPGRAFGSKPHPKGSPALSAHAKDVASIWVSLEPQRYDHEELPNVIQVLQSTHAAPDPTVDRLTLEWALQAVTQPRAATSAPPAALATPVPASRWSRITLLRDYQVSLQLDEFQAEAAFNAVHYPVSVVRGPPGCGKTRTLVATTRRLQQEGYSVLIVAHANAAIEAVAEQSGGRIIKLESITRQLQGRALAGQAAHIMGTEGAMTEDDDDLDSVDGHTAERAGLRKMQPLDGVQPMALTLGLLYKRELEPEPVDNRRRQLKAAREEKQDWKARRGTGASTYEGRGWALIIDEASQVWDALSLPALAKFIGPSCRLTRLMVVGDDHQLSPFSEQTGRIRSLRSVFDALRDLHEQHSDRVPLVDLRITYRLPRPLAAAVSKYFYSSILEYQRNERRDVSFKRTAIVSLMRARWLITTAMDLAVRGGKYVGGKAAQLLKPRAADWQRSIMKLAHLVAEEMLWDDVRGQEGRKGESWVNTDEASEVGRMLALLQYARRFVPGLAAPLPPTTKALWAVDGKTEVAEEDAVQPDWPGADTHTKVHAAPADDASTVASGSTDPRPSGQAKPISLPYTMAALSGYEQQTGEVEREAAEQYWWLLALEASYGVALKAKHAAEHGSAKVRKDRDGRSDWAGTAASQVQQPKRRASVTQQPVPASLSSLQQGEELQAWLPYFQGARLACNTDAYQGKEAHVVLVSLCRTGQDLGFLEDQRRTNVMLTRASQAMLICGHAATARLSAMGSVASLPRRRQTVAIAGQGLDARMDMVMLTEGPPGLHPGLWACMRYRCWSAGRVEGTADKPDHRDGFTRAGPWTTIKDLAGNAMMTYPGLFASIPEDDRVLGLGGVDSDSEGTADTDHTSDSGRSSLDFEAAQAAHLARLEMERQDEEMARRLYEEEMREAARRRAAAYASTAGRQVASGGSVGGNVLWQAAGGDSRRPATVPAPGPASHGPFSGFFDTLGADGKGAGRVTAGAGGAATAGRPARPGTGQGVTGNASVYQSQPQSSATRPAAAAPARPAAVPKPTGAGAAGGLTGPVVHVGDSFVATSDGRTVYVTNVNMQLTDTQVLDGLEAAFPSSKVVGLKVVRTRAGRQLPLHGFAFARFEGKHMANRAVRVGTLLLGGMEAKVTLFEQKQ